MYKYLLCWKYLRTRYIALASVISVMLGVATMIVVNSVMAGFAEKMRTRLHGVLADVVVESVDLDGFPNSDEVMERIRGAAGEKIEAMAVTLESFAIMKFNYLGRPITRQVQLIGVKPLDRARTGDFAEYIVNAQGRRTGAPPSFEVAEELRKSSRSGRLAEEMKAAGGAEDDPFFKALVDDAKEEVPDYGVIMGWALATIHRPGSDHDDMLAPPGTKIRLVFPTGGNKPAPGYDEFTVVNYFKSGMSEYDSTHVYVPLERLQFMRHLGDGAGRGAVNQIQIKVKPGVDIDDVQAQVQEAMDKLLPRYFVVSTWEQKQGPLLAAVQVEQNILNMLLFFIIAVAGFGILAIFSMIVVEKTRDIGVMKALGATSSGVRSIFLGYGLLLGAVGAGAGMAGGLAFVAHINWIEQKLSVLAGRKLFDDTIYYFDSIPTLVDPRTVACVVGGALLIAAAASVWPAHRAARLDPVRALRYE